MTDPMSRTSRRHYNDHVIDRILNGDTRLVGDDDELDHEPDPHAWWDEERAIARMEDAYEREIERNHP